MNLITTPIKSGDKAAVTNLQDAILFLVEKKVYKTFMSPNSPTEEELKELTNLLQEEKQNTKYGDATLKLVLIFQIQQGLGDGLQGIVEDTTAAKMNEILKGLGAFEEEVTSFIVKGTISWSDGKPYNGGTVLAFDHDIRTEEFIAKAITNEEGYYEIEYTRDQFLNRDKKNANLQVKVMNEKDDILVSSEIFYNAADKMELNLAVEVPKVEEKSEWEIIDKQLSSLLKDQNDKVQPEDLVEKDINFLSKSTDIEPARIGMWSQAYKNAKETEGIAPAIFYGWQRMGLAADTKQLFANTNIEHIQSIESAVADNIISAENLKLIPEIKTGIEKCILDNIVSPAPDGLPASYGDAIRFTAMDITAAEMQSVGKLLSQDLQKDEFKGQLGKLGLDGNIVSSIERGLALHSFTKGFKPLISLLAKETLPEFKFQDSLRDLALISKRQWKEIVQETGVPAEIVGKDEISKRENFANELFDQIERTFPTAVLAADIKQGGWLSPEIDKINIFLRDNIEIELKQTNIYTLHQDNKLIGDDYPLEEIAGLQRIMKVCADTELIKELFNKGYRSATDILNNWPPLPNLSKRFGPGLNDLKRNIGIAHGNINMFFGQMNDLRTPVKVLPGNGSPSPEVKPTWDALFGSADYCTCDHCSSVLSPSAYFVDLLRFLDYYKDGINPLNVLLKRRPDLGEIELSCANTDTPVFYLDLVLELLEAEGITIDDKATIDRIIADLDKNIINQAFKNHHIDITDNAKVKNISSGVKRPHEKYIVTWEGYRMLVSSALGLVARVYPQTPSIINNKNASLNFFLPAYAPLATASFPWTLPFNIPAETVNIYLQQAGIRRNRLMMVLKAKINPNFDELQWINDIIGITNEVADKIVNATTQLNWGFDGMNSSWVSTLAGNVNDVLHRSRLSYDELSMLMGSRFINPLSTNGEVSYAIQLGTEVIDEKNIISCDLSKASITGTDLLSFFDKLHRFVRLWRNFKWPIETLDNSIAVLGAGLLDRGYLKNLGNVLYLAEKYNLSADYLKSFLADTSANKLGLLLGYNTIETNTFLSLKPTPFLDLGNSITALLSYLKVETLNTWDLINKCSVNILEINYWITNNDTIPARYKPSEEDVLAFVKKIHATLKAITDEQQLDKAQDEAVLLFLSTSFGFEENIIRLLVSTDFISLQNGANSFKEKTLFLDISTELKTVNCKIQFDAVEQFYRIGQVVKALKLTATELSWLKTLGKGSWLASNNFNDFLKLLELIKLRNSLDKSANIITGYLALQGTASAADVTKLIEFINIKLGWQLADPPTLKIPLKTSPDSFATDFTALKELVDLLRLYNLTIVDASILAGNNFDAMLPITDNIFQTRFQSGNSNEALESIQNNLRLCRRDCLVDYLVNSLSLENSDGLYERFLIDTQMAPCAITTRLKQAIASVQLFVHRCIAGLEKVGETKIILTDEKKKKWEWMKLYRVWEANRKVFLYPENWLSPELRTDKSSFFREFESELLQNEVNSKLVTRNITVYADKLNKISKLNLLAINTGEKGTCYMVGCTYTKPAIYYFRQRSAEGIWTAWQKIDTQLQGEHIGIVPYNNQLFLYWLEFKEKEINKNKVLGVDLANSIWQDGKWSTKDYLLMDITVPHLTAEKNCVFIVDTGNKELSFLIYNTVLNWILHYENYADPVNYSPALLKIESSSPYKVIDLSSQSLPNYFDLDRTKYRQTIVNNTSPENMGFNLISSANLKRLQIVYPSTTVYTTILSDIKPTNPIIILPASTDKFPREEYFFTDPEFKENYFIYKDDIRTYTVKSIDSIFHQSYSDSIVTKFLFETHYNPFVKNIINGLYSLNGPLDGLAFEKQNIIEGNTLAVNRFNANYNPPHTTGGTSVSDVYPKEQVDFNLTESYAIYNWELFFHLPFLAARSLSQNQRFAEARDWMHYLFNPTIDGNTTEAEYWNCKPLRTAATDRQSRSYLQLATSNATMDEEWRNAIEDWLKNPFQPDIIARHRPLAYNKAVVMSYIDNLVAWGDQLFGKDTIESINEASMLYVLASNILGEKPKQVKQTTTAERFTFNDKRASFNNFENFFVKIENAIPTVAVNKANGAGKETEEESPVLPDVYTPFFCIPHNEKLIGYWDTVSDRLFKIRNCMNIAGVKRQLPLWDPPIDPAILVKAASFGIDIADILAELGESTLPYRYQTLLRAAQEFCNEVKSLGSAFLSALEKKDAEEIARLRSTHEIDMMDRIRSIKEQQIADSEFNLEGLRKSRSKSLALLKRYQYLLRKDDIKEPAEGAIIAIDEGKITWRPEEPQEEARKLDLSFYESEQLVMLDYATGFNISSSAVRGLSSVLHLFPDLEIPLIGKFGGTNLGLSTSAAAEALSIGSMLASHFGQRSSIMGGYERRVEEWKFQCTLATKEIEQIDKQIAGADIRVDIAKQELNNHDNQAENARSLDEWMQNKFTKTELYTWMQGQLFGLYKQAYQMAFQMAKKAERGYNFELGTTSNFIKPGYWDSFNKGLLAGESLSQDLRRMDAAFLEKNVREFEITKHISLATLNAMVLLDLRKDGICNFQIPELLFEMDFPGHYFRRIKSVSISIPCIAGPYTSVSSQLSLSKSYIRKDDKNGGVIFDSTNESFKESYSSIKSIATSNAQGDSGMFELNFRDERYLPFEGAGVISDWELELPKEARQFDYNTISDVIITIRYTARNSGSSKFKNDVNKKIKEQINQAVSTLNENEGLYRLFSLKNDFPDLFHEMKGEKGVLARKEISIGKSFFPYFTNSFGISFTNSDISFYKKNGIPISPGIVLDKNKNIKSIKTIACESLSTVLENKLLLLLFNPSFLVSDEIGSDDIFILINYKLNV